MGSSGVLADATVGRLHTVGSQVSPDCPRLPPTAAGCPVFTAIPVGFVGLAKRRPEPDEKRRRLLSLGHEEPYLYVPRVVVKKVKLRDRRSHRLRGLQDEPRSSPGGRRAVQTRPVSWPKTAHDTFGPSRVATRLRIGSQHLLTEVHTACGGDCGAPRGRLQGPGVDGRGGWVEAWN